MLSAALSITEFGEEGEHRLAVLLGADRVHVVLAGEPHHLGVAHGCRVVRMWNEMGRWLQRDPAAAAARG